MKRVVFIVLMLLANTVYAQYISSIGNIDGSTGNLVYTDVNPAPGGADPYYWSGFGSTTSNGGGYSGGYQPAWNGSTGTFMFGYNQGTIRYTTPVNFALANAGTNVQVNGFRYSWEYLNQDFSRGTLSANINLTNANGQIVQNYNYNMPQTTNGWTLYSGIENFNTQYSASTLGNLNVSFTGKDDRWWAGYYGPQVRGIDVGLLYTVTPPPVKTDFLRWEPLVSENSDFTLTTSGVVRYGAQGTYVYANFRAGTYSCTNSAWGVDPIGGVYKQCEFGTNNSPPPPPPPPPITLPKTTTPTTDYTTAVQLLDPVTTPASIDPITTTPTTTTTTTTTDTSTPATSTNTAQTSTVNIVAAPASTTTSSSTTTTSNSTSSSSSTSTNQSSTKESSGSSNGGNVGLALSIINKNADRDAAGSAVAQSAVAQAQTAATQAQQEAASVASNAVSNSMTANAVVVSNQQSSGTGIKVNNSNSTNFTLQSGQTTMAVMGGPQLTQSMFVQQQGTTITSANVSTGQQVSVLNTGQQQSTNSTSTNVVTLLQPQQTNVTAPITTFTSEQQIQQQTVLQNNGISTQLVDTYSMLTPNMLTDKSNPLTDIVEGKVQVPQNNVATAGPTVNKNTQDNDVATGVSINKMAIAPTGYGDYLNFTMRDVVFYAPKEVYKNQRNVDNVRVLRQLTTDRLHQEMVEQQFRR